jgi:hypothetical protein
VTEFENRVARLEQQSRRIGYVIAASPEEAERLHAEDPGVTGILDPYRPVVVVSDAESSFDQ